MEKCNGAIIVLMVCCVISGKTSPCITRLLQPIKETLHKGRFFYWLEFLIRFLKLKSRIKNQVARVRRRSFGEALKVLNRNLFFQCGLLQLFRLQKLFGREYKIHH